MSENFITIKTGEIRDEFAIEEDKKKAYQIFTLSGIFSIILTIALYFVYLNI